MRTTRFLQAEVALVSLALLIAPLAIGGVHLPIRIVLTILLLLAFSVMVWRHWQGGENLKLGFFGLGLGLLVVWTFFQWVPVPAALVSILVPGAGEAREIAATILGVERLSWHPMSLDGSQTAMSWVSLLGYWLTFIVCRNAVPSGWGPRTPLMLVLVATLLVLLVGGLHSLFDLRTEIYGFYPAGHRRWAAPFVTSFVNSNHGAACLLLGTGTGLALWFAVRHLRRRWLVLVAVLLLALGTIGTGSRAAILLLPALLCCICLTGLASTLDQGGRRQLFHTVLGLLCLLVVLTLMFANERWHEEMHSLITPSSQFAQANFHGRWALGLDVARQYLWLGSGLGTFGVASPALASASATGLMDHSHNIFLQMVADWGLPVSLCAGGLMVWGFGKSIWSRRSEPAVLVVALTCLTLLTQNMVDFSFHIPGVGLLVMAAMGWLSSDGQAPPSTNPSKESTSEDSGWWREPNLAASPTLLLVLVGGVCLTGWHATAQSSERWGEQARAQLGAEVEDRISIESMLMEHPSDFHLFGIASALAWEVGDRDRAWALMNRAVELAPLEVQTRLARARLFLHDEGPDAAVPDLLVLAEHGEIRHVIEEVLRWPSVTHVLEQIVSRNEEHVFALVSVLRAHGGAGDTRSVLEWGMDRFPESVELAEALAEHVMWTPGHTEQLDALATKILTRGVDNPDTELSVHRRRTGYMLQGFVYQRRQKPLEAYHLFLEAAQLDADKEVQPFLLAAGAVLTLNNSVSRLRKILKQVEPQLDEHPRLKREYHRLKSFQYEMEGDKRRAIEQMHKAVLYSPTNPAFQKRLSALYEAVGQTVAADTHRKRYQMFSNPNPNP